MNKELGFLYNFEESNENVFTRHNLVRATYKKTFGRQVAELWARRNFKLRLIT